MVWVERLSLVSPPGIELAFEAETHFRWFDGAQRLSRLRSKLLRAERIVPAKERRPNVNVDPDVDAQLGAPG